MPRPPLSRMGFLATQGVVSGPLTWADVAAAVGAASAQGLRLLAKLGRARDWRQR